MFGGLSITELVVILIIALLVFGPSRLPQMGKALGSTIKEFKNAANKSGEGSEPKPTEEKK